MRHDPAMDLATHPRLARMEGSLSPVRLQSEQIYAIDRVPGQTGEIRKTVRSISPAVDAFNCISLKYVIPCGGDDMDSVEGDVTLGRAVSDETFAPIFKPEEIEHPDQGEVIYVNRRTKRVLCRRWNWRNADFSKILPGTRNLAINVDGMLPAIGRSEIEAGRRRIEAASASLLRRLHFHSLPGCANPEVSPI